VGAWIVLLGAVAAVAVTLNLWATGILRREIEIPHPQRRAQLLFIWLVPVLGALIAVEVYRRTAFRRSCLRTVADEIDPIIDQALRLLADEATRASEHYIEQDLLDFGHDVGGHGHSDSPH
jgi:hypothetical protein